MSNPFDFALGELLGTLHSVTRSRAVYRRGNLALEIGVTWGTSDVAAFTDNIVGHVHEMTDAIVQDFAPLLARFGLPQQGDTITQDGITRTVLPAAGDDVYTWSGVRRALRIHTKITAES